VTPGAHEMHKAVHEPISQIGYSSIFGIILVGLGALMGVLSFVRFKKVERQIEEDTFRPSRILDMLLAITVMAIGIFMVIYLYHSI
jgi:putative membrane protein